MRVNISDKGDELRTIHNCVSVKFRSANLKRKNGRFHKKAIFANNCLQQLTSCQHKKNLHQKWSIKSRGALSVMMALIRVKNRTLAKNPYFY